MLPALILILAVTLYRVGYAFAGSPDTWANFSPLAAILLCSAAYLPRQFVLLTGLGPLLVTDLILNIHYHQPLVDSGMVSRYLCFGLLLFMGGLVRRQHSHKLLLLFVCTLIGSTLFYLLTNTSTWFSSAVYAKTLPGWWQALTTGEPGYPPTWLFFRNTLLSDLFFTALFVITQASFHRSRPWIAEESPTAARNQT
jgi:hypothetical protein